MFVTGNGNEREKHFFSNTYSHNFHTQQLTFRKDSRGNEQSHREEDQGTHKELEGLELAQSTVKAEFQVLKEEFQQKLNHVVLDIVKTKVSPHLVTIDNVVFVKDRQDRLVDHENGQSQAEDDEGVLRAVHVDLTWHADYQDAGELTEREGEGERRSVSLSTWRAKIRTEFCVYLAIRETATGIVPILRLPVMYSAIDCTLNPK